MADLTTSVRYIKGIGEKKAQAFGKLGVFSLYDLVSYFPSRYEDRTRFCPIAAAPEGEVSLILASYFAESADMSIAFEIFVFIKYPFSLDL